MDESKRCQNLMPEFKTQCVLEEGHKGNHTDHEYQWWDKIPRDSWESDALEQRQPIDPHLVAALAAPMVPALLARWEARIGQAFGPHQVTDPRAFAVAEARVLAERLLGPSDARIESTIRTLWGPVPEEQQKRAP